MDNTDITFLLFAWDSLTEQQQYRINMRYELKKSLENLPVGQSKRSCYRDISSKFTSYSMDTIEYIANH